MVKSSGWPHQNVPINCVGKVTSQLYIVLYGNKYFSVEWSDQNIPLLPTGSIKSIKLFCLKTNFREEYENN